MINFEKKKSIKKDTKNNPSQLRLTRLALFSSHESKKT